MSASNQDLANIVFQNDLLNHREVTRHQCGVPGEQLNICSSCTEETSEESIAWELIFGGTSNAEMGRGQPCCLGLLSEPLAGCLMLRQVVLISSLAEGMGLLIESLSVINPDPFFISEASGCLAVFSSAVNLAGNSACAGIPVLGAAGISACGE